MKENINLGITSLPNTKFSKLTSKELYDEVRGLKLGILGIIFYYCYLRVFKLGFLDQN